MSRTFFRVIFAIILFAVLIGAGVMVYNAGVSQGMLVSGSLPAISATPGAGAPAYAYPYPYYPGFYRQWGFGFHFFPFGFIFPLLFFLLFFFLIRGLFFGRMMHRGMMYRSGMGPWGDRSGSNSGEVPPMVAEWHRKMHEEQSNPPTPPDQPGQNKP